MQINPNLISKPMPLKTIINIPIIISYIIELQRSKFGLGALTYDLQTSIWLDLARRKVQIFSYGGGNWGHIFWVGLREIGRGQLGVKTFEPKYKQSQFSGADHMNHFWHRNSVKKEGQHLFLNTIPNKFFHGQQRTESLV